MPFWISSGNGPPSPPSPEGLEPGSDPLLHGVWVLDRGREGRIRLPEASGHPCKTLTSVNILKGSFEQRLSNVIVPGAGEPASPTGWADREFGEVRIPKLRPMAEIRRKSSPKRKEKKK